MSKARSAPLWSSETFSAATGVESVQSWQASGVHVDSRDVYEGDLFIALSGANNNGHKFVAQALANGAVAAVVSAPPEGISTNDRRLIYVPDTYEALCQMAVYARGRSNAQVIGVTGSVGKTSVVQALRQCLWAEDGVHASIRSFNNHVGVPLSLVRMPPACRYGVFELGMSAAGEIDKLVAMVKPDVSVVTTVGAAHLQAFDTIDAIARAKSEIFAHTKAGGTAIIGLDHDQYEIVTHAATLSDLGIIGVTAASVKGATVKALSVKQTPFCTCMTADIDGTCVTYKIAQPGKPWILNSLMILATIKAVGGDLGYAALRLAALTVEKGRGGLHHLRFNGENITLIDDSYNANPVSMKAAFERLALLPRVKNARVFAVLGDMSELGVGAQASHENLSCEAVKASIDKIFTFGPFTALMARQAGIPFEEVSDIQGFPARLKHYLREGDIILIKGSNSTGLGYVADAIGYLSNPLDYSTMQEMSAYGPDYWPISAE